MKKTLLFNVIALFSMGAAIAQGYTPSAATGIASGSVGATYSQVITFVIPDSVTVDGASLGAPVPITVNAGITSTVLAVSGLPAGLTASCDQGNCTYGPGAQGSITISGTPTEGGTFTVAIGSTTDGVAILPSFPPFFAGGATPFPQPAPGLLDSDDYTMDIAGGGNAVEELNVNTFDVIQNVPNPFSNNTTIKFSSPAPASVDFVVYDMLGNKVFANKVAAQTGINSIKFNAINLSNGAYFYTISNGSKTFTKRMIITGK